MFFQQFNAYTAREKGTFGTARAGVAGGRRSPAEVNAGGSSLHLLQKANGQKEGVRPLIPVRNRF